MKLGLARLPEFACALASPAPELEEVEQKNGRWVLSLLNRAYYAFVFSHENIFRLRFWAPITDVRKSQDEQIGIVWYIRVCASHERSRT